MAPIVTTIAPGRRASLADVRDAAAGSVTAAGRTPLLRLDLADVPGSPDVHVKLDVLQPIESFKIRGAYNVLRQTTSADLADAVWTVSAGNAAQGVAFAARRRGAPCSVMVMDTAPDAKIRAIERLGASIVRALYDECWSTVVAHRSDRMAGRFIHPFDVDRFIAGNGPIGLEILEDVPDVEAIVAPFGGGGLVAGIPSACAELRPEARIYAAEPVTAAPLSASRAAGRPLSFEGWTASFVDAAGGRSVLEMWPRLTSLADSIVVSLDDVTRAMRLVAERARVIADGAGCAVAAAFRGRAGRGNIVAVVSGGNIDISRFASLRGAC
jgi:threonine dehydratase